MSWFSSFMHPGRGYDKAQEQLNNYYGQSNDFFNQGQGFQQPYNQWGQESHGQLQEMLNNLMNPEEMQKKWIESYNESPAATQAKTQATQSGLDAASKMGLGGSNTALQAIEGGASNIALADRQNYLNDLMDKYKNAVGIATGIYGTGAGAANTQSQLAAQQAANAARMGENSAEMSYGKQQAGGNLFSRMLGSGMALFGGDAGKNAADAWNTSGGNR